MAKRSESPARSERSKSPGTSDTLLSISGSTQALHTPTRSRQAQCNRKQPTHDCIVEAPRIEPRSEPVDPPTVPPPTLPGMPSIQVSNIVDSVMSTMEKNTTAAPEKKGPESPQAEIPQKAGMSEAGMSVSGKLRPPKSEDIETTSSFDNIQPSISFSGRFKGFLMPAVMWQWEHRTGFKDYTKDQSERIEVAYRAGHPKIRLKAGKKGAVPMEIFFGDMIQYDPISGNSRNVRRSGYEGPAYRARRITLGMWHSWIHGTQWRESFSQYQARRQLVQSQTTVKPYDVSDHYHETGWAQHIAKSAWFQGLAMFLIVGNTIWQWYELDASSNALWTRAEFQFAFMDNLFCSAFSLELFIRFLAFEAKRQCLRDNWFRFDLILVFIMVLETWIVPFFLTTQLSDYPANLAILRMFRLVRLVRVARLLKAAPKLYAMLQGIVSVIRPVIYTMILLMILLVIFVILFRTYIKAYPDDFEDIEAKYFSSCIATFWTLLAYGTFTDGITIILMNYLLPTSTALTLGFLVFVFMSSFTVLNMLIGIICEAILRVTEAQDSEAERQFLEANLSELLSCYDKNSSESLGKTEIDMVMSNPETIQYLTTFGTDVELLKGALEFQLENLKPAEDGEEPEMEFKTFIDIAKRLRDGHNAKIKDVMDLRCYTSGRLDQVQTSLDKLLTSLVDPLAATPRFSRKGAHQPE